MNPYRFILIYSEEGEHSMRRARIYFRQWLLCALVCRSFDWNNNAGTRVQYKTVKELIQKSDVDELICATDAGREGELILRLLYNQTGTNKPYKSSMEESATVFRKW